MSESGKFQASHLQHTPSTFEVVLKFNHCHHSEEHMLRVHHPNIITLSTTRIYNLISSKIATYLRVVNYPGDIYYNHILTTDQSMESGADRPHYVTWKRIKYTLHKVISARICYNIFLNLEMLRQLSISSTKLNVGIGAPFNAFEIITNKNMTHFGFLLLTSPKNTMIGLGNGLQPAQCQNIK